LEDAIALASPQEGPQGATIGMMPPPPMPAMPPTQYPMMASLGAQLPEALALPFTMQQAQWAAGTPLSVEEAQDAALPPGAPRTFGYMQNGLPLYRPGATPMGALPGIQPGEIGAIDLQRLAPTAYPQRTPPPYTPPYGSDQFQIIQNQLRPVQVAANDTPAGAVQPYQYLLSRGTDLNAQFLNPTFAGRLTRALQDAESATGQKASLSDLYRPAERQAQYYADYTRHPVTFGGTTYQPNPNNQGGLAAPPGRSLHEQGLAADVRRGPVLDYLHQNAGRYGLEFLKGSAFQNDPVHIQMAGGRSGADGSSDSVPVASAGGASVPGPYGGASAPSSATNLMQLRQSRFGQELSDPNTRRLFAASVNAEVGGQGPRAEQAYVESVMNRAASRGMTLEQAIRDVHYYPSTTINKLGEGFGPDQQGRINGYIQNALRGSNVANYATGNESGSVHSGGAPVAFDPRTGERFVQENADRKWVTAMAGGMAPPAVRAASNAPIRYAQRDTGTMTDASPELPYQMASVNVAGAPDEQIQQPEEYGPPQEDPDIVALRDYAKQLQHPTQPQAPMPPLPPIPPVDLQAASTPVDESQFPSWLTDAMVPDALPSLTHTVIGADGQPQRIQHYDAEMDPTIGMTKGIMQSPEFLQRFANGEIKPLSHMSIEDQKSMSHIPPPPIPDTAANRAADAILSGKMPPDVQGDWWKTLGYGVAGLPSRTIQGMYGLAMTPGQMAEKAWQGDTSHMIGGENEQEAMDWANNTAQMLIGKTPFKTPRGLGVAGGKIITPEGVPESDIGVPGNRPTPPVFPRDAETGQFVSHPDMPIPPRDPATGQFLPRTAAAEPMPPPAPTQGLSPVGQLLEERKTQQALPEAKTPIEELKALQPEAATPATLPPAPQLPPANRRLHGTNPRALGSNPRAVAARKAAEEAARVQSLGGVVPSAVPESSLPVQAADIAQRTEAPVPPAPTGEGVRRGVPITRPVGPSALAAPVVTPPAATAIPVDVVPANQVPGLSQTAPAAPAAAPVAAPTPFSRQSPPANIMQGPAAPPPSAPSAMPTPPAGATWEAQFTPHDYSYLANDRIGPITSYAAKTGLTPAVLDDLQDTLREYTGAQSQSLANAAVEEGRAISPHFRFEVPVSLRKIEAYANFSRNRGFREYLNANSDLDEVRNIQRKRTVAANANPQVGPPMIHGKTEADLLQEIRQTEQAHPDWVRVRGHYKENILESRRGQAEGEHSIMTKSEELNKYAHNPNEVPVSRSKRAEYIKYPDGRNAMGEPLRRPDPIKSAMQYVTTQARKTINEQATGKIIDTLRQSPGARHMFTPKRAGDITDSLQHRHVTSYRRGVKQHWVADNPTMKDLIRFGPDHFSSGTVAKVLSATKRLFVASTTGLLQVYFAPLDTLRNYRIAKGTSGGMRYARKAPGLAGLGYAVGSSSLARLARHASYSLDATSGGWLRHAFGDNASNHIASILANQYARSTVANIRARGTHSRGLMRYGTDSSLVNPHSRLRAMVQDMSTRPGTRQLATLGHAYRNLLNDVHSSTQTAAVQKNFKRVKAAVRNELGPSATEEQVLDTTYDRLVSDSNALVGDPLVSGTAHNQEGHFIRYQTKDPMSPDLVARAKTAEAWVFSHDVLRTLPWHNMSMQGLKAFPKAAKRSPTRFALKALTAYITPPVLAYLWNTYAGADPEGTPYIRHQLYGRNEYRRGMYLYIAWPGRRAAEGIEMPWFQEGVFPKMAIEAVMSHMYGDNYWSGDHSPNAAQWTKTQDAKAALSMALDVVLPPTPPLFGAGVEALGASAPGNLGAFFRSPLGNALGQNVGATDIGGDTFMRKQNPYDSNKVMSQLNESLSRAVSPAILDMWLAGYGAYEHSDETGYANALKNGLKQMGKLQVQRTPLLNNAFNTFAPPSGNTRMVNEMYNREQAIRGLLDYYHQWGMAGEQFITKAKPTSPSGFAEASKLLGPPLPPHSPGLGQEPPNNPLYIEFAKLLDERFSKDSLNRGGMGFRSLWDRYNSSSKAIQSMRYIDFGNMATWKQRIEQKPDVMQVLKNAGVDHTDPFAVRSWYERYRQLAAREINAAITRVEDEMTARHPEYGRHISIQDLSPHNLPADQSYEEEGPQP
jgi:hypothetical protein